MMWQKLAYILMFGSGNVAPAISLHFELLGSVGSKVSLLHEEIVRVKYIKIKCRMLRINTQDFLRGSLRFNSNL